MHPWEVRAKQDWWTKQPVTLQKAGKLILVGLLVERPLSNGGLSLQMRLLARTVVCSAAYTLSSRLIIPGDFGS